MGATKKRISVTIIPTLAEFLEEFAKQTNTTKSAVVESALKYLSEKRLANDAKKLANMKFDDLPTEDEWLQIQTEY